MPKKTHKTKNLEPKFEQKDDFFFVDNAAKEYKFSNFVRVTSYQHGMVLYFGKWFPTDEKMGVFDGILLPFDVAARLGEIIKKQMDDLVQRGILQIPDSLEK